MSLIRDELRSSKMAMANVFSNPAMRRIFLAFSGSIIGDGVFTLSAIVYAYRTGGATAVGVVAVARYVAWAVTSPFASTFADRYNRKYVMVTSDLIRLALVTTASVLVAVHSARWLIYLIVVLVSAAGSAFRPAQASILPLLARRDDEIAGANVVSSTIESIGFFAGPAIAGFLLAYADVAFAFAFDAATFVWSALLVISVRPTRPEERSPELVAILSSAVDAAETDSQPFLVRAAQGFRFIVAERSLLILVVLYSLQSLVAGASTVFTVAIALKLLHIGSSGLGFMESLFGIGGLVGGFLALMLIERARVATDFGLGVIVWAAPLILIALWPSLGAALVAMSLIGAANSVVDVNAITVLQHIVPNERLGRVLGALMAAVICGMALGSLLMTILIHWTGLREGLALIGGVVTLAVLPGLPTMRRIDLSTFADGVTHPPSRAHRVHHLHHMRLQRHQ